MPERGGKRSGAGRKSNADRLRDAQEAGRSLASWFTPVYQESKWKALLESRDERVQFRALAYLSDRLYGKPSPLAEPDASGGTDFTLTRIICDLWGLDYQMTCSGEVVRWDGGADLWIYLLEAVQANTFCDWQPHVTGFAETTRY